MGNQCQDQAGFSDELRLIPRWAMVAAVAAFALVEYYFWVALPGHNPHPSRLPFPLRFYPRSQSILHHSILSQKLFLDHTIQGKLLIAAKTNYQNRS